MVWIDVGGGIDLQAVVLLVGIFEEAVHGIECFVREMKEPFAGDTTVVKAFFAFEQKVQSSTEFIGLTLHNVGERIVEEIIATDG